ncbi:hypothetical protein PENSPDRAFT_643476 [Peniophora sp. CONT]|nr:hypothetical protein PENSPDRAFT_643476 [Peniophora sp. CONT]
MDDHVKQAQALALSCEQAGLHIASASEEYRSHRFKEDKLGLPAALASDTSLKIKHMRRIKLKYLEVCAQDQYIKCIVADDPPEIGDEDTEVVLEESLRTKATLKESKAALAEKYEDIRRLAPLVQDDYDKVTRAHKEASDLASRELDTRLALVRSRRDHSGPRYTVASAEEKAASQVQDMQTMELDLQRNKQRLAQYKERMKELYKEESRLRSERAELEKKYGQRSGPNPEDAATRERYLETISAHCALEGLQSTHIAAENELRLTYDLSSSENSTSSRRIVIALIFIPNSRRLSHAVVEGFDEDELDGDALTSAYVNANDVPGLVASVLNHGRKLLQPR